MSRVSRKTSVGNDYIRFSDRIFRIVLKIAAEYVIISDNTQTFSITKGIL